MTNELFSKGIAAAQAGDLETARKLFSEVVRQNPQSEKGWLALAHCLSDPDKKAYCFERVLVLNPHNKTAERWLRKFTQQEIENEAQEKLDNHSEPRTIVNADGAHQKVATTIKALYIAGAGLVILVIGLLIISLAFPHLFTSMSQRLIANYSEVELARQHTKAQRYMEAIPLWDEIITVVPEYADAYYYRGVCYLELARDQYNFSQAQDYLERANIDLTRAIELGPPKGDYYSKRVDVIERLAKLENFGVDAYVYLEQVLDDLLQAYSLGNSYKWGNRSPGIALLNLGRCEESLDYFQRLAKERGRNAIPSGTINGGIADSYFCQQRYDEALKYAQRALSIRLEEGIDAELEKIRLAEIYHALGRYHEALEMMDQVIAASPGFRGYRYYTRALMYYELGERTLALADLEYGATQTWERYRYRAYVLGLLALDDGDQDEALHWLQLAQASLLENIDPFIYEQTLAEINKLEGSLLFSASTPTPEIERTPIPVVADQVYFTPTPQVAIPPATLANFGGTGIVYFPANGFQAFLFRPVGYHEIQQAKSLSINIDGDNLGKGPIFEISLMALDGSGYGVFNDLKVGETQLTEPHKYVSSAGYFYAIITNKSLDPVVVENISFQLQGIQRNGADFVLGYK